MMRTCSKEKGDILLLTHACPLGGMNILCVIIHVTTKFTCGQDRLFCY
uniref:Uncharacterized protein n=1 Tax=Arundo donax TaxID=35708 RepID=A0A0A9A2U0_ARUDO